jgi:hypothetical protein
VNLERAAPGRWLRLTALAASAACLLAVVSGVLGWRRPHRLLAVLGLPPLIALVAAALAAHPPLRGPSLLALGLYGAAASPAGSPPPTSSWPGSRARPPSSWRRRPSAGAPVPSGPWRDYLTLTKPRIMSLLLVTGFFAMLAGERGLPPPATVVALVGGLGLACGGASALNHVLDRDIDRLMGKRTADRPVASGRVPASHALEFGLALTACSFTLLAALANLLAATLALAGGLFYVLVYTRWLKRSTPHNIVIGGAAGAMPPLVGWAAATGKLTLTALALFAIVFLWTPPHFWALALPDQAQLRRRQDPDAPGGGAQRPRDHAADPGVLGRARRRHPRPGRPGPVRARLPRGRGRPRGRLPLPRATGPDAVPDRPAVSRPAARPAGWSGGPRRRRRSRPPHGRWPTPRPGSPR